MKRVALIFGIVLCWAGMAYADINRTLRTGMRGPDVRELQIFLNGDPDTQVALTGVGSPGYESDYYGARTALAVNRLQAKYAIDILTPAGLYYPTGVVGLLTRTKIAQLRLKNSSSPAVSSVSPAVVGVAPRIDSVSPSVVTKDNEAVTLYGSFAGSDTRVVISSESKDGVYGVMSPDGNSISFQFSFSLARKLSEQVADISGDRTGAIRAIVENLQGPEIEKRNGRTYARVILVARNSYGESLPQTLYIDLLEVLTS